MKMTRIILLSIIPFVLATIVRSSENRRRNGNCPWLGTDKDSPCPAAEYLCNNGKCIDRAHVCNDRNDCGDNSDERSCGDRYGNCGSGFKRCPDYTWCKPSSWFCDGIEDCPDGADEEHCEKINNPHSQRRMFKASNWLYQQRRKLSATERWGSLVDKSVVAFYFTKEDFNKVGNETRSEIAYEVTIQLLSRIFRKKLQDIPSTDLASYVNAFLVTCLDPRNFHGIDIVKELRNRTDHQNYTNPYVYLSLCNAGETLTELDTKKLMDTFWNKRRIFWTDMQAVAVMALACASQQSGSDVDQETLHELTMVLKQQQYRNGSVENLQTTALVMQALLATESEDDPDNFDENKALEQIMQSQNPDGSFGSLTNTYFVLPVLRCKSLINISSSHCQTVHRDEMSALVNLANRSGSKMRVQYSLWIGNDKDMERNLALRVPSDLSLYGVMEIAAEIDSKFRFDYTVKNRKPYINSISDLQDNPENGRFWFLYTLTDGQPTPTPKSPADVMPKDNDHFIMWYRSGSWVE